MKVWLCTSTHLKDVTYGTAVQKVHSMNALEDDYVIVNLDE